METTKKTRRVRKAADKKNAPAENGVKKVKLLVTVVDRRKAEFSMDFLTQFEINLQTSVLAQGTAHSQMLSMLGLEDAEKSVIFSAVREDKASEALAGLEEKFHTIKNGKGIAFTIPLSSVIGVAIYRFLSNHRQ